ncbi:MAG: hypothetical protein KF866_04710 [Phycisphaeraceae bacterium]|nr:hypothetical protein [Phycisphaeraceae bacterium]MCW5754048.1 hypothetical protein [Phycisphaeraceae bacterium]
MSARDEQRPEHGKAGSTPRTYLARLERIDRRITRWMHRHGHRVERLGLGVVFMWFGMLKILGQESATSIIAKTVYIGSPSVMVPALGVWEVLIGVCLMHRPLLRAGIALLMIRLPGTLLALAFRYDECFSGSVLTPTVQGQYLLKDAALLGAALVLGSTVRARWG